MATVKEWGSDVLTFTSSFQWERRENVREMNSQCLQNFISFVIFRVLVYQNVLTNQICFINMYFIMKTFRENLNYYIIKWWVSIERKSEFANTCLNFHFCGYSHENEPTLRSYDKRSEDKMSNYKRLKGLTINIFMNEKVKRYEGSANRIKCEVSDVWEKELSLGAVAFAKLTFESSVPRAPEGTVKPRFYWQPFIGQSKLGLIRTWRISQAITLNFF